MIYHVSVSGSDQAAGTAQAPFRTINHAASVAIAGDTVQVHSGEYREWVKPANGGTNEGCRITYEAAPGEHPIIKGSEIVTDWEHAEGTIWKKVLPNDMFGEWNPYALTLSGDWFVLPKEYPVHLGDVYINGVSMFEAASLDDLYHAPRRDTGAGNMHGIYADKVLHPEQSIYRWFAQVGADTTTLLCNFQDVDPNKALIEINVRRSCFFPDRTGLNYITVRGFEMAHAACPFTPPTADQPGMLGPNWSKGWIIENNHLHDAKCSAISIGKEASTGHNFGTRFRRRFSHYYQTEAVFAALYYAGWCKEKIGSHIVRNNVIHDCGQNGIVGHMGGAFSRIEHNHIYNISVKREFFGHELGGIKLHAAIDAVIKDNHIHHCAIGTWLDWQVQGVRVTGNLFHHNDLDLFIEVTHGPCTVDNNIMLSEVALNNHAQGTAYVHNLITGLHHLWPSMNRETPYHFPHTTQVKGVAPTQLGDDRFLNNLFPGTWKENGEEGKVSRPPFCQSCDRFSTPEEYEALNRETALLTIKFFHETPQPVWIEGNAYAGHAKPFRKEVDPIVADGMTVALEQDGARWLLKLNIPHHLAAANCRPVTTARLDTPRYTEQPYENPDGTPIDFTTDYHGNRRTNRVLPGPFAKLIAGEQSIPVWEENN